MSISGGPDIIENGLVLYLDAADNSSYISGSGNTWYDMSGNGNNATLVNTPVFNGGNKGYFAFDGANSYVSTTVNLNQTMTVSLWYRRQQSDINVASTLLHASANNYPSTNTWFELTVTDPYYGSGGTIEMWAYSSLNGSRSDFLISPYPVSNYNVWKNMCLVFNNSTGTGYINGVSYGSSTPAFTAWDTATNRFALQFARGRSYDFNGGSYRYGLCDIASINVYNRALSANEILQNYNSIKGRYNL